MQCEYQKHNLMRYLPRLETYSRYKYENLANAALRLLLTAVISPLIAGLRVTS